MEPINSSTDKILVSLENLCKDRFTGYAFVVMDGEDTYHFYSSRVMADGAARYLERIVDKEWGEE